MNTEQLEALKKVLEYLSEEKEHFRQAGRPANHIWHSLAVLELYLMDKKEERMETETTILDFSTEEQGKLCRLLKNHFPWLGTDEEVSGADVIDELNSLFKALPLP